MASGLVAAAAGNTSAGKVMANVTGSAVTLTPLTFSSNWHADAGADAELAHLAGHVGEQLMLVIELHAVITVRQNFGHGAVEFKQVFLRHVSSPLPTCAQRGARCA